MLYRIVSLLIVFVAFIGIYQRNTIVEQNHSNDYEYNNNVTDDIDEIQDSRNKFSENDEFIPMDLLLSAGWTNVWNCVLIYNESMINEEGRQIELWRVIWDEIIMDKYTNTGEAKRNEVNALIKDINDLYAENTRLLKNKIIPILFTL